MKHPHPVWSEDVDEYYDDLGVCMLCGDSVEVGDEYYLDAGTMIYEPPRVFHVRCAKERREDESRAMRNLSKAYS